MESHLRSLIKAITFRFAATVITILIVFFFTKSHLISVSVGALEFFSKLTFYYIHERIWNRVNFGRRSKVT